MATYVLIHGFSQGGWIWKLTAQKLRGAGHDVHVPTLDGCAERAFNIRHGITITSQATEVANLLFYEDLRNVVLVGTSTGGLVICKMAELVRERIQHVVFVDALAPQPGESVDDIVIQDPNYPHVTTELTRGPSKEDIENRMFEDLQPDLKTWAIDRVSMHPIGATDAPGEINGFWAQDWPATVIRCRLSVNPSEEHQRRTADKLKADWHELDSGHYPMLSHPAALTRILMP